MSIISKLSVFSEIDQQLVKNIKLFYLNKHYLLFVLTDNSLFHYNLRDKEPPKKFESLCEKQFTIKFDGSNDSVLPHFLALTDKGCVFSFGDNTFGQLGTGTTIDCVEPKLIDSLRNEFVTDICCSLKHSIVLTRTGYVYAFGNNSKGQCGIITDKRYQTVPAKLEISNVTAISCGGYHSIALTLSGDVFGWGDNSDGQLGFADTLMQSTPRQLSVVAIQQIVCGKRFTLMLSEEKDVYICGEIEKAFMITKPTKINSETKFIEIGANISSDLCFAMSENRNCYIFGKHKNEVMKELKQTETYIASIEDAYALYEQITCKIIRISSRHENFIEKSVIGSGGFGFVFKCECKSDNKLYAIKKVCFKTDKRETVLKELKFLSLLDSKFVVKYIDSWVEDNYYIGSYTSNHQSGQIISSGKVLYKLCDPYLLHIQMELCSLTLKDVIDDIIIKECLLRDKTLSLIGYYISSKLFIELLECVQYLHQQNPAIIHRDLKPENILITFSANNRFIKLSDFGLSTFHEYANQSHTGGDVGTANYIAPEILDAYLSNGKLKAKYTTKADIYSLGTILKKLFHFDISGVRKNYIPILLPKMNSLIRLTEVLLSPVPYKRPTCDELLTELQLLRLTNEELETDHQFMQIKRKSTKSCSIDTDFIAFFIHYSCNSNQ